jgi:hypothetical protein
MMMTRHLPVAVEQMIESALDKGNPLHIRENYVQTLTMIRDRCDVVINDFNRKKIAELAKKNTR